MRYRLDFDFKSFTGTAYRPQIFCRNGVPDRSGLLSPLLPLARQGIDALLGFDFLSAHYTEVALAILLKMIFRVFSFSFDQPDSRSCSWSMTTFYIPAPVRLLFLRKSVCLGRVCLGNGQIVQKAILPQRCNCSVVCNISKYLGRSRKKSIANAHALLKVKHFRDTQVVFSYKHTAEYHDLNFHFGHMQLFK